MRSRSFIPAAVVGASAFLLFVPTLFHGFQWDDFILLSRPEIQSSSWPNLRWMLTTTLLGHYVPLTWLSWALDMAWGGGAPFAFHFTNIMLHAANTALVFLAAKRFFALAGVRFSDGGLTAAGAAALFFAWHPLRVESVAWVTERRGLLSAFFCLLAALRHWDGDRIWPPALILSAVFSKEMAMSWPVTLFISDVIIFRRMKISRWFLVNGGLWGTALAGAFLGSFATMHEKIPVQWGEYGPISRMVQFFQAPFFYCVKTVIPLGLSPLYPIDLHRPLPPASDMLLAVVGILLTTMALLLWRRAPFFSAAWATIFCSVAPVSGFLQSGPQATADRYSYLAVLPIAFAFGGMIRGSWTRVLLLVLPALAFLSFRQQGYWRNPEALWERAVSISPSSDYALYNLGEAQLAAGREAEAEASFRRALVRNPTLAQAHYNLGFLAQRRGDLKKAEGFYRRVLWISPGHGMARNNLGKVFLGQGRRAEAREQFAEALRLLPDSPVVRRNWEETSR